MIYHQNKRYMREEGRERKVYEGGKEREKGRAKGRERGKLEKSENM